MLETYKIAVNISTAYRIKPTQHTNELAEKYKTDITANGVTFEGKPINGKLRGYIRLPLFGMASRLVGPVTMEAEDVEVI